jgi:hypothetical protein
MKEHKKLKKEVVKNPENAVYIKGFGEATSTDAIKTFFSQYGEVTGVLSRHTGVNRVNTYLLLKPRAVNRVNTGLLYTHTSCLDTLGSIG